MGKFNSIFNRKFSELNKSERIKFAIDAHKDFGNISRKKLMSIYGITQIQAGLMMRDYIHEYASKIEWVEKHSHYEFTIKK